MPLFVSISRETRVPRLRCSAVSSCLSIRINENLIARGAAVGFEGVPLKQVGGSWPGHVSSSVTVRFSSSGRIVRNPSLA